MSEERISRRSLIKKGAIAGGAMMWATPVVQSLTMPAGAATPEHNCCSCNQDIIPGFVTCVSNGITQAECDNLCSTLGGVKAYNAPGNCLAGECVPA